MCVCVSYVPDFIFLVGPILQGSFTNFVVWYWWYVILFTFASTCHNIIGYAIFGLLLLTVCWLSPISMAITKEEFSELAWGYRDPLPVPKNLDIGAALRCCPSTWQFAGHWQHRSYLLFLFSFKLSNFLRTKFKLKETDAPTVSSSSSRASPGWSVAINTSCLHRSLSWASHHAELSPWLSGWNSAFTVRSQV